VAEGDFDAIVLAAAGLHRLGHSDSVSDRFDPRHLPPAPGQGALAVQVRKGGGALPEAVARIDDPSARRTSTAERVCLRELGGGCARPVGAYAWVADRRLTLAAFVGSEDGTRTVRAEASADSPDELGRAVAAELLGRGAAELLA
jgi:hydroxymethylbilane synthase